MKVVVLGLTLSSSWGNGHATTWRALLAALAERGHQIAFLEADRPWYAAHRDLAQPAYCDLRFFVDPDDLARRYASLIDGADVVISSSYVPDGTVIGRWLAERRLRLLAFYDIDTPVTLAKLAAGEHDYLSPDLLPAFDLYLSFTGGPTLARLEGLGVRRARALYCSVDPRQHAPAAATERYALGYLGTYSPDRQPGLEALLVEPARALPGAAFAVAGPQYPAELAWPDNVERIEHLPPPAHAAFYAAQRFTLNVTRRDMAAAGWSPSVRLFEAAAALAPIMSDAWPGLESILAPGHEVLVVADAEDVLRALRDVGPERRALQAAAARRRVLAEHSSAVRARQLEEQLSALLHAARPVATERRVQRMVG